MSYQDYMYGKYDYPSRVDAQSRELIALAKKMGASDDLLFDMHNECFPQYPNYPFIEESVQTHYREKIQDGTLLNTLDPEVIGQTADQASARQRARRSRHQWEMAMLFPGQHIPYPEDKES